MSENIPPDTSENAPSEIAEKPRGMTGKLLAFLIVLASFPDTLARFQSDYEKVGREYGLSDQQIKALKSNDYQTIKDALRAENPDVAHFLGEYGNHFRTVTVSDVQAVTLPFDKGALS